MNPPLVFKVPTNQFISIKYSEISQFRLKFNGILVMKVLIDFASK